MQPSGHRKSKAKSGIAIEMKSNNGGESERNEKAKMAASMAASIMAWQLA